MVSGTNDDLAEDGETLTILGFQLRANPVSRKVKATGDDVKDGVQERPERIHSDV